VENGDHPIISGGAFQGEKGVLYLAAVVGQPVAIDTTFNIIVVPRGPKH
jgi:hypothetical protein